MLNDINRAKFHLSFKILILLNTNEISEGNINTLLYPNPANRITYIEFTLNNSSSIDEQQVIIKVKNPTLIKLDLENLNKVFNGLFRNSFISDNFNFF